ncbi:MAG: Hpt domain-containing protein [Gemmatimonadota bacterium]
MNGSPSPELLEFYLVEATEYVDAMDRLVAGGHTAPDLNALIATARALRGSSAMAKVTPIAEIGRMVEQVAQRCRDGDERWSSDTVVALRSTVDDLRMLVRDVRIWGERESGRAESCRVRLQPFLGSGTTRSATPTSGSTTPVFLALQAAAIAAELDAFVDNPANRRSLDDALTRSRTMRGIAGIADYPPLSDVGDVIDRVGRQLMPDAPLTPDQHELFRAGAALMRRAAEQLRTTGRHEPDQSDVARFARAVSAIDSPPPGEATVVRIDQLFHVDDGPHVVRRSQNPPVQPHQRLARELVARSEHLRRLVADARNAADTISADRATRELRRALGDLSALTQSFGAVPLADVASSLSRTVSASSPGALSSTDQLIEVLERPFGAIADLAVRATALATTPVAASALGRGAGGTAAPARPQLAPRSAPQNRLTPPQPRKAGNARTPTGRELQNLLASGVEALRPLEAAVVTEVEDDRSTPVPIETLLYRGRAAIDRAIELRDAMRQRGETDVASLEEIFDLLGLARQD